MKEEGPEASDRLFCPTKRSCGQTAQTGGLQSKNAATEESETNCSQENTLMEVERKGI